MKSTLRCPNCDQVLTVFAGTISDCVPFLCVHCHKVCLYENGDLRKFTEVELLVLRQTDNWKNHIAPAIENLQIYKFLLDNKHDQRSHLKC